MSDPEAHQRALLLAQAAANLKAEELVLLDVSQLTVLADYFLICNGTSDRHVRSIADRISEAARESGSTKFHSEGLDEGRWILLDYGDVVVHVFDPPTREYYRLEELWGDAPRVAVDLAA